jgi:thiol-disulfide isomerase/thioredoxin
MNRRRPQTRTRAAAVVLALVAVLSLAACTGGGSNSKDFRFSSFTTKGKLMPAADRKPAQDFSGDLLDGGKTSLSASKGKVTIVNFFASWCGPCQAETPQLALLSNRLTPKGVAFLGIDTKDNTAPAKTFVAHSGVKYPVIYDQQGKTALELGNIPGSLPFTVLVDKTGKVAAVYEGIVLPKDLDGPISTLSAES